MHANYREQTQQLKITVYIVQCSKLKITTSHDHTNLKESWELGQPRG